MVSLDHLEMKHRGHRAAPDLNILLPSQKGREREREAGRMRQGKAQKPKVTGRGTGRSEPSHNQF